MVRTSKEKHIATAERQVLSFLHNQTHVFVAMVIHLLRKVGDVKILEGNAHLFPLYTGSGL